MKPFDKSDSYGIPEIVAALLWKYLDVDGQILYALNCISFSLEAILHFFTIFSISVTRLRSDNRANHRFLNPYLGRDKIIGFAHFRRRAFERGTFVAETGPGVGASNLCAVEEENLHRWQARRLLSCSSL